MNNRGIVISGGQFSATQVAVGDQASINNDAGREGSELLGKLDELLSAIQAADIRPSERDSIVKNIDSMKEQATTVNPDKTLMARSLHLIEKAVPAVTGVVSILAAVKSLVGL